MTNEQPTTNKKTRRVRTPEERKAAALEEIRRIDAARMDKLEEWLGDVRGDLVGLMELADKCEGDRADEILRQARNALAALNDRSGYVPAERVAEG